tara:strand:+ start:1028 stop:1390 length:363 start_codon:yes stop_codon:yes gene_type:complete
LAARAAGAPRIRSSAIGAGDKDGDDAAPSPGEAGEPALGLSLPLLAPPGLACLLRRRALLRANEACRPWLSCLRMPGPEEPSEVEPGVLASVGGEPPGSSCAATTDTIRARVTCVAGAGL